MEVMAKFGLIGNPISHSKSPSLFAAAYGGKCGSYELIEADSCVSAMERFIDGEYRGINVTAPYKEQVLEYVTDPDRASCELGNANLLLKDENHACNGRIYSYNTDYYGVKNTVKELLSGEYMTDAVVLPEIKRVTVVGAGGAGKAAALAMADSGYKVCLVNRSPERAVAFANKIGAEYVRLEDLAKAVEKSQLLIYSLSMPVNEMAGVDLSGKIVFEANYAAPNLSPSCGIRSLYYLRGEYWLYNQAVPAFELFTGCKPDIPAMKKIIGI